MRSPGAMIDCDSHFWQPFEAWERFVEPRDKDAVARWLRDNDPMQTLDAGVKAKLEERMATLPADDPRERLAWLDAGDMLGTIIYPGTGLVTYSPDERVAAAASRALNRFAADFADADRARLKPCMALPWRFPDAALREFERANEEDGLDVIFAAPTPDPERRWSDPALDPIWQAVVQRGAVLTFHEFTRLGDDAPLVARKSYQDSYPLTYLCGHCVEAQLAVMDLIGGGVLERFPELQVGIVEAHVAWLPGWLATMDGVWPRVSTAYASTSGTGSLSRKPSEYFQRQCFIVAFPDDAWVEEVVQYVGEDNVMLCTDYPHPQTRDTPQDTLAAQAPGLDEGARHKVLRGNACRVFGFSDTPTA